MVPEDLLWALGRNSVESKADAGLPLGAWNSSRVGRHLILIRADECREEKPSKAHGPSRASSLTWLGAGCSHTKACGSATLKTQGALCVLAGKGGELPGHGQGW